MDNWNTDAYVDTGEGGLSASTAPGHNTDNGVVLGQWAAGVSLAGIATSIGSADHAVGQTSSRERLIMPV